MPVEPNARIITEAERYAIAHEVVSNYTGSLSTDNAVATVTATLLKLAETMDGELKDPHDLYEHEDIFRKTAEDLEKSKRTKGEFGKDLQKYLDTQRLRLEYLPLVEALKKEQAERGVITFGEQMSIAATLAKNFSLLGEQQSARYRVAVSYTHLTLPTILRV